MPLSQPALQLVITGRARPTLLSEIAALVPEANARIVEETELADNVEQADIVATVRMTAEALARAKRLKWVQSWAAGPNELLYDAFRRSPVLLTSCAGNGAVPLAEHAMMLMLALARDMKRSLRSQGESRWDKFRVDELMGKTVGIVGVGHAGSDLAIKAKAFHMKVIGMRRRDKPAEHFDETFSREEMHVFLAQCDFVAVTAALTQKTRGMLDETAFRSMKPTAFYVCVSRGAIAETDALERALRESWIAGAGLDAHAIEPLPAESPFWTMPNVIVTPHIGAVSEETIERGNDIFLENLRRYLAGEPLVNIVDKETGY